MSVIAKYRVRIKGSRGADRYEAIDIVVEEQKAGKTKGPMIRTVRLSKDYRREKISANTQQIAADKYITDERLEVALDRLLKTVLG